MEIRLSQAVAFLAVVAIAAGLWFGSTNGAEVDAARGAADPLRPSAALPAVGADTSVYTDRNEGSAVPCAFPLRWRVARVDPRFELSKGDVERVVAAAGGLWEDAVGRSLFSHDPEGGFPIRLVYDERQASSRELRAREADLDRAGAAIRARREEIEEMERGYQEAVARYRDRAAELDQRVEALNDTVQRWNRRGGAPEDVARRIRATEDELRSEQLSLDARLDELNARRRRIEAAFGELRSRVRDWEGRVEDLEGSAPTSPVQSGIYREAVRLEGDRVDSVDREIRIYRFDDENDLRRVVAHELGHAMGLGHVDAARALMNAEYAREDRRQMGPTLTTPDLNLLGSRCPEV